jgi:hypothetical protein
MMFHTAGCELDMPVFHAKYGTYVLAVRALHFHVSWRLPTRRYRCTLLGNDLGRERVRDQQRKLD